MLLLVLRGGVVEVLVVAVDVIVALAGAPGGGRERARRLHADSHV
jgi:hypothetical protein